VLAETNVFNSGSKLVATLLQIHFGSCIVCVDPACSVRSFLNSLSDTTVVVCGDLRKEVKPDWVGDFKRLPFRDGQFDVGLFDPPFKRGVRQTEDYYTGRYGPAPNNENAATKQYMDGLPELFRVCARGVVAKIQDASDGHTFHDRRFQLTEFVKSRYGIGLHDVLILDSPSKVPQRRGPTRRFSRQTVSYFLVWKYEVRAGRYMQVRY
jgi:hypothetical protein